jgi:hypothetical protein
MSYTPFQPTSPRAIAGLGFQQRVFDSFVEAYPDIEFEMTWDYFSEKNPELGSKELAILEKEWGDITYEVDGVRHWVECCFAMGTEISRLCERKRKNFVGERRWYCYGFAESDEMIFIPSITWNSYTAHIEQPDRSCRIVPLSSIRNLRKGKRGIENYWQEVHGEKI